MKEKGVKQTDRRTCNDARWPAASFTLLENIEILYHPSNYISILRFLRGDSKIYNQSYPSNALRTIRTTDNLCCLRNALEFEDVEKVHKIPLVPLVKLAV